MARKATPPTTYTEAWAPEPPPGDAWTARPWVHPSARVEQGRLVLKDQIKAEFDKRADAIIPEFVTFYNTLDDKQREVVTARLEDMSERMSEGGRHHRGGWGKWRENDDN